MLNSCTPALVGLTSVGTMSWTRSPAPVFIGDGIVKRLSSAFVVVVHMPLVRDVLVVRSVIVSAGAHVRCTAAKVPAGASSVIWPFSAAMAPTGGMTKPMTYVTSVAPAASLDNESVTLVTGGPRTAA